MTTSEMLDFCTRVAEVAKQNYNIDDGADLCFNLMEQGLIEGGNDAYLERAARIVVLHGQQ